MTGTVPSGLNSSSNKSQDDNYTLCKDRDKDGYGQGTGCLGLDCNDYDGDCNQGDCCLGEGKWYPIKKGKYLTIVEHHADVLLTHALDRYGKIHTPLFVDAINTRTLEPYVWEIDADQPVVKDFNQPSKQIMANFQFMQLIVNMLRELTKLTEDGRYLEAARSCVACALQIVPEPSGLFHWGKHATYDALSDQRLGHPGTPGFHYFPGGTFVSWRFLYSVDPEAVNRHIEQQWNTTINSNNKWRRLEWSLHPQYLQPYDMPWENVDQIDANLKVPFATKNAMYPQIAFELLYAALNYSEYPGNDSRSWEAVRLMMKRFMDSRNTRTGLWPVMYSYKSDFKGGRKWYGSRIRDSLGIPFFAKLAEITSDKKYGNLFLDFALKDLIAFREYKQIHGGNMAYSDVTLDGKHRSNPGEISDSIFWSYALIYRMTGERVLWNALRDIARGRGYGDIGEPDGSEVALKFGSDLDLQIPLDGKNNISAGFIVHAFVELYKKTKQLHGETPARVYLEFAGVVADKIIEQTYVNGVFARSRDAKWARTASMTPMALLHIEAAMQGKELEKESVFFRQWAYRFTRSKDTVDGDNYHDWAIYSDTWN